MISYHERESTIFSVVASWDKYDATFREEAAAELWAKTVTLIDPNILCCVAIRNSQGRWDTISRWWGGEKHAPR